MEIILFITFGVLVGFGFYATYLLTQKKKEIEGLNCTIRAKNEAIDAMGRETSRLMVKIHKLEVEISELGSLYDAIKNISKPTRPERKYPEPTFIPTPSEKHTAIKAFDIPVYHSTDRRTHSSRSTRWDEPTQDHYCDNSNDGVLGAIIAAELISDLATQHTYASPQEQVFVPAGGQFDGGGATESYSAPEPERTTYESPSYDSSSSSSDSCSDSGSSCGGSDD